MMLKNPTLILIYIIVTFNHFTFATAPLKWRGGKLFNGFEIFSNKSSLEERATVCPAGYFKCLGTDKCCPTKCASLCGIHCCPPNYICCGDGIGGCCQV